MDVILLPRGAGKTPQLLDWMRGGDLVGEIRIGVFHSLEEQHRQFRAAYERGEIPSVFESWQFVSITEVTEGSSAFLSGVKLRYQPIVLGIDNLDLMLPGLLHGWSIGMVTMTNDAVSE